MGNFSAEYAVDETQSLFNYLRVNESTGEAEMRYHLVFRSDEGKEYIFEGHKYMQRAEGGGLRGMREDLSDYTTLFCHVFEMDGAGAPTMAGVAYLKFRTFEDLAAAGNLAGFLSSFKVTGTGNPAVQLQAQMRFLAFTGQFVQLEYDVLSPDAGLFGERKTFHAAPLPTAKASTVSPIWSTDKRSPWGPCEGADSQILKKILRRYSQ